MTVVFNHLIVSFPPTDPETEDENETRQNGHGNKSHRNGESVPMLNFNNEQSSDEDENVVFESSFR